MSDVAIRVEGLSKRYRIGGKQEKYKTLRDALTEGALRPFRAMKPLTRRNGHTNSKFEIQNSKSDLIWALKDVSFEVKPGEVIGIIGRNGAGKSTLLKILSRITEPTAGFADIHGRVGSLLEVGTGFHPELTGRENIYLNGAILGMRRAEIRHKFDEIISFAEVEKFIDTPVKHYSSGLYLRLAFAVAAHMEPEILLVDEVLAVGDLSFQKKCLGKMGEVAAEGRTVLFVSHNLAAIKELCQTSIVLNHGLVDFYGPALQGVAHYAYGSSEKDEIASAGSVQLREVSIDGQSCCTLVSIVSGEPFRAEVLLDLPLNFDSCRLLFCMEDGMGSKLIHHSITAKKVGNQKLGPGIYRVKLDCPPLWLASGLYTFYFKFNGSKIGSNIKDVHSERVLINITEGYVEGKGHALLAPKLRWTLALESEMEETEIVTR